MTYDLGIIGGGLAGLSLAITMRKKGYSVLVIEKGTYPRMKVCGEYISRESQSYLEALGVDLTPYPSITKLELSDTRGRLYKANLPLGGIGISRYALDYKLSELAQKEGVILLTNKSIDRVSEDQNSTTLYCGNEAYVCRLAFGCFGKRSNLDVEWSRKFITSKSTRLNNYIGVKYHINYKYDKELIGLYNFEDGYCGISAVEDEKYCLCYLTKAHHLQKHKDIRSMEEQVLQRNPILKSILTNATFLNEKPISIAQISFEKKPIVEHGMMMLGDAAAMISPLSGNGMSIAMHCGYLASEVSTPYLDGKITKAMALKNYEKAWHTYFDGRINMGRLLQYSFGKAWTIGMLVSTLNTLPQLGIQLIKSTHGKSFYHP